MRRHVLTLVLSVALVHVLFAARVPVVPGSLCEVSFTASVERGPAVEDDPELAELLPLSVGRPARTGVKFTSVAWNFIDASGKRMRHPHIANDGVTLFSRNPRRFSFRVYVPQRAVAVEVKPLFLTEGESVRIRDLAAEPVKTGKVLNQNADFSADDVSLPGWRLTGAARLAKDRDGVPYAALEDGGVFGDLFPVPGGRTLSVTLKAAPPRFATKRRIPWGAIHFFDSYEAAEARSQPFARPKLTVHSKMLAEKTETYRIPNSAKWCRIVVRVGDVYRCEASLVEGGAK